MTEVGFSNPVPPIFVFQSEAEELIRLEKGKFFWKGKEVKDKHKVYERFNEWLTTATNERNT